VLIYLNDDYCKIGANDVDKEQEERRFLRNGERFLAEFMSFTRDR
jgi:hypothetical protein